MKLQNQFLIFVVLMQTALFLLAIQFIDKQTPVFILAELLVIASIVFSVKLYNSLIRPIKFIISGIENIKTQDFSSKYLSVGQKEMDQLIDIHNRMLEQLREERIRHQEQNLFLDRLINASPSGIIILDADDRIVSFNPAIERLLGTMSSPIKEKKLIELKYGLFDGLHDLKDGESVVVKLSGVKTFKVHKTHFVDKGYKQHFILIEELTEEIRKAEKKSYEKIIRMMSHEINNSIGAINSILHSSLNYSSQLNIEDKTDYVNAMEVAIERNNRLNRFMSNFADIVRIPPPAKTKYNLNKLIQDAAVLMHQECSNRNIKLNLLHDDTCPDIYIDIQQFEQVVLNIIKNSIESIEKNGTIEIETKNDKILQLKISDDGKGITKEIQDHLFTPFYSSKRNGQGIGLTLIREILINHGCEFSLETNQQGKTEFIILFINS
jgi:two-component system, NtrC family, nitrogen regulation sensor histidine kinase NtrY